MANKKTRLLIVEDNVESALKMREVFGLWAPDWEIDVVHNGVDAVSTKKKYDLVLLDMGLPHMTGEEVLLEWWKRGFSSRVVVLTGNDWDSRLVMRCAKYGASDFLIKGGSTEEVFAALKKCLHTGVPMDVSVKDKDAIAAENSILRDANQMAMDESRRLREEIERLEAEVATRNSELEKLRASPKSPSLWLRLVCVVVFLAVVVALAYSGQTTASQIFSCVLFFVVVLFGDQVQSITPTGAKMKNG